MRIFELWRRVDVSGVSGTGLIAHAVTFDDGTTVVRWRTVPDASTAVYDSLEAAIRVHGHDGNTAFIEITGAAIGPSSGVALGGEGRGI